MKRCSPDGCEVLPRIVQHCVALDCPVVRHASQCGWWFGKLSIASTDAHRGAIAVSRFWDPHRELLDKVLSLHTCISEYSAKYGDEQVFYLLRSLPPPQGTEPLASLRLVFDKPWDETAASVLAGFAPRTVRSLQLKLCLQSRGGDESEDIGAATRFFQEHPEVWILLGACRNDYEITLQVGFLGVTIYGRGPCSNLAELQSSARKIRALVMSPRLVWRALELLDGAHFPRVVGCCVRSSAADFDELCATIYAVARSPTALRLMPAVSEVSSLKPLDTTKRNMRDPSGSNGPVAAWLRTVFMFATRADRHFPLPPPEVDLKNVYMESSESGGLCKVDFVVAPRSLFVPESRLEAEAEAAAAEAGTREAASAPLRVRDLHVEGSYSDLGWPRRFLRMAYRKDGPSAAPGCVLATDSATCAAHYAATENVADLADATGSGFAIHAWHGCPRRGYRDEHWQRHYKPVSGAAARVESTSVAGWTRDPFLHDVPEIMTACEPRRVRVYCRSGALDRLRARFLWLSEEQSGRLGSVALMHRAALMVASSVREEQQPPLEPALVGAADAWERCTCFVRTVARYMGFETLDVARGAIRKLLSRATTELLKEACARGLLGETARRMCIYDCIPVAAYLERPTEIALMLLVEEEERRSAPVRS